MSFQDDCDFQAHWKSSQEDASDGQESPESPDDPPESEDGHEGSHDGHEGLHDGQLEGQSLQEYDGSPQE